MKALTLHQPWASLVALGVKTIETRSWSTDYRGPLAIHAGAKLPDRHAWVGDYSAGPTLCGEGGGWSLWRRSTTSPRSGAYCQLPLGAVVATARLVDVVPIVAEAPDCVEECGRRCAPRGSAIAIRRDGQQATRLNWKNTVSPGRYIDGDDTDQLPHGDFTVGRFAWLLDDIEPVDPSVPARGRQRLWEWTP